MSGSAVPVSQKQLLKRYAAGIAAAWTLAALTLVVIDIRHERLQAAETALTQARSNFQRDVIYRSWNAKFGPI